MDHDCGFRVAYRKRLVLLDIVPTRSMYEQTTEAFASADRHWFFLIQPALTSTMTGRIATLTACFIRRCWHCGGEGRGALVLQTAG
jgi:hypothetical protein